MGGAVVVRFLSDNRVKVHSAVIDGGITPYQLPCINHIQDLIEILV